MLQKIEGKAFLAALIPVIFMTFATVTYIFYAPEGLRLSLTISNAVGLICAVICFMQFLRTRNQIKNSVGLHAN